MTNPIPNVSAAEARVAKQIIAREIANQVASQASFTEEVDQGFNPGAAEREQGRFSRFRTLENRTKRSAEAEGKKIKEVSKKKEDDLANQYSRRNPELSANKLRALRESLRGGQSAQEVMDQVLEAFPDPTLADEVLEYLSQEVGDNLKEGVAQAKELLNKLYERQIIAGRNIDEVAKSFHQQGIGTSPTSLRELYREITGNPRDHNKLFTELSEQFPFDQLKAVVAFMLKGLAYDLKSKGPSIQSAELIRIMTNLRNLQSILWVYLFFKSRMKLIRSLYAKRMRNGELSKKLSFEKLSKQFIRLVEDRYPNIPKLLKEAEELGLIDNEEKIIIISQYRDALRQLSPRLYKSLKHRQELLLLVLETLSELEEEDEEDLEEV